MCRVYNCNSEPGSAPGFSSFEIVADVLLGTYTPKKHTLCCEVGKNKHRAEKS